MADDARQQALEAMSAYAMSRSVGDLHCDHAGLLDAVSAGVLARLAVERGWDPACPIHTTADYGHGRHPASGHPFQTGSHGCGQCGHMRAAHDDATPADRLEAYGSATYGACSCLTEEGHSDA